MSTLEANSEQNIQVFGGKNPKAILPKRPVGEAL
ncbi:hypothetical protein B984_02587 [Brucella melitensis UK31/99]|nr:hypothetical protein B984_02587 [Brucella melitensis UK31/99]